MKNDKASMVSNTLFRLGGVGFQYLLFFITALLVSRILGQSGLGDFFLAVTILNLLGFSATLGLKQGVVRYVAIYLGLKEGKSIKGTIGKASFFSLAAGILVGLILYLMAPSLARNFFHSPALVGGLRIVAVLIPILAVFNIAVSGLQGLKDIKSKVWLENIIQPGLTLLILVAVLGAGGRITLNVILVAWGGAVLICLLSAWFRFYLGARISFKIGKGLSRLDFRQILFYSLPLMGVGFLYYLFTRMDIIMLGNLRDVEEVGIYGVAARLALLISLPLEALNVSFEPAVAQLGKEGSKRLGLLYRSYTPWVLGVGLCVALALLFSSPLVLELFGREFSGGWMILGILGLGQVINLGVGSAGVMLSMTGHSRIVLYNCLAMVGLNFVLNLLLIPPYGAPGAALATAAALGGINLLRLMEVYLLLRIHPFSLNYLKVLGSGFLILIVAGLTWYLLNPLLGRWTFGLLLGLAVFYAGWLLVMLLDGVEGKGFNAILNRLKLRLVVNGDLGQ